MSYRCRKCRARFATIGPRTKCTPACGRKPCRPSCKVKGGCGRTGCREHAFTLDRYRKRVEVGRGPDRLKTCVPWRGGCSEYSFPHRIGSGFCIHNSRVTDAERQDREERGFYR